MSHPSIMLIVAILEGVGALIGSGFSELFDQLIPSMDLDFDGPDLTSPTLLSGVLSVLKIGHLPILVLFVLFLLIFGVGGLLIQDAFSLYSGHLLARSSACLVTLLATLPILAISASLLAKVLPRDETSAISRSSLIEHTAQITLGTTKKGAPCQAKARDRHGKTHYFMVEPANEKETFHQGDVVQIVRDNGLIFFVIRSNLSIMNKK